MYKIFGNYGIGLVFETNDKMKAINYLKDMEEKDYDDYLLYKGHCEEEYEQYAYYNSNYYILYKGKVYDITNYRILER